MNPSASGVFFVFVAGVKYAAMLRAVSALEVASFLSPDVTDCPCNYNPARITKFTANNNVLNLMLIVDFYCVYDFRSCKKRLLFLQNYKKVIALYYMANKYCNQIEMKKAVCMHFIFR
jgi:hypothetical protein